MGLIFNVVILSFFVYGFRLQECIALIFLSIMFFRKKMFFNKKIIMFFILFLIISISKIYLNNYSYKKNILVIISLIIIYSSYYNFFKFYGIKKIIKSYLEMSKIIVYLGFLIFIASILFDFNFTQLTLGRSYYLYKTIPSFTSICGEPGMYAQIMFFSFAYSFKKIFENNFKIRDILVVCSYLLTGTAISLVGLILSMAYIVLDNTNKKRIIKNFLIIIAFLSLLIIISANLSIYVKSKFIETFLGFKEINNLDLKTLNLSSFALVSNFKASILSKNYLFGTGFGTIDQNYYKYFINKNYQMYGLNATDGYSLLIRIFSELGLFGLTIVGNIYFFKASRIKNRNWMFLSKLGLFLYLLRGGSYYLQGTSFYIMLIFFLRKKRNVV